MVNVLIGCTGSVACVKAFALISQIKEKVKDAVVRVVATEHAKFFLSDDFSAIQVSVSSSDGSLHYYGLIQRAAYCRHKVSV